MRNWWYKRRARNHTLYSLYALSRRISHQLYELRCLGDYLSEPDWIRGHENMSEVTANHWGNYDRRLA